MSLLRQVRRCSEGSSTRGPPSTRAWCRREDGAVVSKTLLIRRSPAAVWVCSVWRGACSPAGPVVHPSLVIFLPRTQQIQKQLWVSAHVEPGSQHLARRVSRAWMLPAASVQIPAGQRQRLRSAGAGGWGVAAAPPCAVTAPLPPDTYGHSRADRN